MRWKVRRTAARWDAFAPVSHLPDLKVGCGWIHNTRSWRRNGLRYRQPEHAQRAPRPMGSAAPADSRRSRARRRPPMSPHRCRDALDGAAAYVADGESHLTVAPEGPAYADLAEKLRPTEAGYDSCPRLAITLDDVGLARGKHDQVAGLVAIGEMVGVVRILLTHVTGFDTGAVARRSKRPRD